MTFTKQKKIKWDPHPEVIQDSEWKKLQIVFVNDLCSEVFGRVQDKNIFVMVLGLAVRNAHDALALPTEMVNLVVALLEKMWISKEPKSIIKWGGSLFVNLVPKIIIKKYADFFSQDQLLFNFVSRVYPEIYEDIDNDLKRDIIYVLSTNLDKAKFVQTNNAEKQQKLINDLILLYSVFGVVYVDSEIEQSMKKEFQYFFEETKQLVEKRAENGLEKVSNIDQLVQLVKKITP